VSCGAAVVPAAALRARPSTEHPAGLAPAFLLRPPRRRTAATRAQCTEFISVSGQRAERSALFSDMRLQKRISGSAAAPVPPHAPM